MPNSTPHPAIWTAAMWMSGAIVCFSSMAVAGRFLQTEMTTFEVMLYRSAIGMCVVALIALSTGQRAACRLTEAKLHLLRNISHFTGQNLWLFALTLIPLAHVFALEFTSPLWVAALAPLFLAEALTVRKAIAATLGFLGILIIVQPSPANLSVGHIAAALAAIGFAFTAICTKRLTRTVPTLGIVFWMTVTQFFFGLIACAIHGRMALPSHTMLVPLVILSLAALFAHYCLTKALSLAPATIVFPIDFMRLPIITIVGILVYNEPANLALVLGALVIFGANILNLQKQG